MCVYSSPVTWRHGTLTQRKIKLSTRAVRTKFVLITTLIAVSFVLIVANFDLIWCHLRQVGLSFHRRLKPRNSVLKDATPQHFFDIPLEIVHKASAAPPEPGPRLMLIEFAINVDHFRVPKFTRVWSRVPISESDIKTDLLGILIYGAGLLMDAVATLARKWELTI